MAARAIWKGVIIFGGIAVPVKLYSAVQDRGIHFRLLHDQDLVPVKQMMVNAETGVIVEHGEVQKGAEIDPGTFVLLDKEDLEALQPKESRDIEITRFVAPAQISHQWYDRPYYLGPDESGAEAYRALAAALEAEEREGVARWTMRNKEYVGALFVEDGHLMLNTLRYAGEVVSSDELPAPEGRALEKKEIQMAKQLVAALQDEFDPSAYHDEFRKRVEELIEAKAKGKTIKKKRAPKEAPRRASLEEALAASLAGVR